MEAIARLLTPSGSLDSFTSISLKMTSTRMGTVSGRMETTPVTASTVRNQNELADPTSRLHNGLGTRCS